MGARNAVKGGVRARSKFAKALKKLAEKAAPRAGCSFKLGCKGFDAGSEGRGVSFGKLWLLAVAIAYLLFWEKRRVNKGR